MYIFYKETHENIRVQAKDNNANNLIFNVRLKLI